MGRVRNYCECLDCNKWVDMYIYLWLSTMRHHFDRALVSCVFLSILLSQSLMTSWTVWGWWGRWWRHWACWSGCSGQWRTAPGASWRPVCQYPGWRGPASHSGCLHDPGPPSDSPGEWPGPWLPGGHPLWWKILLWSTQELKTFIIFCLKHIVFSVSQSTNI